MTDTALSTALRPPFWRRLLLSPVAWGTLLLAGAITATLAGDDLSFFPFLLMLVGGWCFGFSFVNATFRLRSRRTGAVLHVVVAVLLGAALMIVVEFGKDALSSLPESARGVVLVLQLAAIPAAGWIWLGLIARVSDVFTRRDAKKRPLPVPPVWVKEEDADGSAVRFPAIELRMRALTIAIIVIVGVGGTGAFLLLIALDDIVMRLGPRLMIILVGVLIALPAYLVFTAVLRRRTVQCTVAFGNDELRVQVGDEMQVIPHRELELLLWRTRSDYARIEIRGAGADISLITGLAKPPTGFSAELPPLPRRVFRRLELAGLSLQESRRKDVVTFRRESTAGGVSAARGTGSE
ncbi:hypothetical protein [Microbacterium sp. PMB16]|uniref:hypothetical protein n=1 Tax=Microbacterium sp. PMB16 TaxID=3120157 RepID=UPI003F4C53AD